MNISSIDFFNKIKIKYFAILLILVISGCATTEKYDAKLEKTKGLSESELLGEWGPPDSIFTVSRRVRMLTYEKSSIQAESTFCSSIGGTGSSFCMPSGPTTYKCKTSFTLKNKVVKSWFRKGNDCKSN